MVKEIWKDIDWFNGIYQISNLGVVRRKTDNFIFSQRLNDAGYWVVSIRDNQCCKTFRVHRLKAVAFIPNPNNYDCINHKDGIKTNNDLDNLEWCTKKMNNKHAYDIGLKIGSWTGITGELHPQSKAIVQIDKNGQVIAEYFSAREAFNKTGISYKHISAVAKGTKNRPTAGGYIWKFKETLKPKIVEL